MRKTLVHTFLEQLFIIYTNLALLYVYDSILRNFDSWKAAIPVLIDLSSAFDTVVHGILLYDLVAAGIEGTALWEGPSPGFEAICHTEVSANK